MGGSPEAQKRLLIIEDDAWIRTFLRDVLDDAGYHVLEAADGRTGLRMIEEQRPDLLLLDLAMPEFTGVDVLNQLQRCPSTREIPVLVASAYVDLLAMRYAGPVAGVLPKPLNIDQLLAAIEQALTTSLSGRVTGAELPPRAHRPAAKW